jgi:two-component system NtrC family response regulator
MAPMQQMLVVDDKAGQRELLQAVFQERGFEVSKACNGDEAIRLLHERSFDIVVTDLKMPGKDGLAVLRAAREVSPDCPVIIVTAYGSIDTAVEAMRLGARDFITKDFQIEEIERKVDRILGQRPQERPAAKARPEEPIQRIVGDSASSRQLLRMIDKIGPSRSSVLITGPSGTGKELVARAIHDASPRKSAPFVALNCAALAPGVLESELFGHEKGAFTGALGRRVGRFERAHGGTLFLDEVGEIDPNIQTKLLRVLQEGEFERVGGAEPIRVDVRIVAATNRDLREAIEQGLFREDFYYRLNVFSVHVEPLRKRTADIPPLIEHFLRKFNRETGKNVRGVDSEVMAVFMRYRWPGNIRELQNVLERAVVLAEGPEISLEDIPPEMLLERSVAPEPVAAGVAVAGAAGSPAEPASLNERTDQMERELIQSTLERYRWNRTKAAEALGLKRTTLQYKIKKLGLE